MKKQTGQSWYKLALLLAVAAFTCTLAFGQSPKRVLVVSVTKGFRHDVIPTGNKTLEQLAAKDGSFTVDQAQTDADLAEKMTPAALNNYDAVIFQNTTGSLPLPNKEAFLAWIKSGKGFVGIHAANDTYHDYPAFIDMIGGEFRTHGAQAEVEVLNQDPKHPACRHIGPSFRILDEIYLVKNFYRERVHGLLTLDKQPNTGMPGDYPIAWTKNYGNGRVFYTSLGHRTDVWENSIYQKHLIGGIRYVLGLENGDAAPQSTELIISPEEAGAGFRPLFNGVDLAGWKLRNPTGRPSWSVQNGMLVNDAENEHGTDLVTAEKYWNFTVRYEYMVPKGANSGFYLRGRYELQILDDGDNSQASKTGNGSFYNFAAPAKFASRKAGQWQEVEATVSGNRVTVLLNGIKIHDNLELGAPTGAEIDRNVNEPGPFFVQGDHGSVAVRNMRIKVLK